MMHHANIQLSFITGDEKPEITNSFKEVDKRLYIYSNKNQQAS